MTTTETVASGQTSVPRAGVPPVGAPRVAEQDISPGLISTMPSSAPTTPRSEGWGRRYASHLFWVDAFAVLWGAAGVHMVHFDAMTSKLAHDPTNKVYVGLTVLLTAAWLIALNWGGSRDIRTIGHGADEYKSVVNSTLALFGALAICAYLFQFDLPRSYLLVMMPAGLTAVLLGRYLARRWLHGARARGDYLADVLVVGSVRTVRDLITDLKRAPYAGYRVIGVCVETHSSALDFDGVSRIDGIPILGGLDDVAGVAQRYGAHTVAVTATDSFGPGAVRRLSWELEKTDAALVLAPALTNIAGPRIHTQPVAGLPLIHVDRPAYRGATRILKKSFDIVGASVLLLLFSPLFIAISLAVKFTSPGAIFFLQDRVGLNGRTFRMIKFRSMVKDAESMLANQREQSQDAGNAILFKQKNDARITKVGKFIRRFSIDELPQLINVLIGDMSLVGPRPPLRAEVDRYEDDAMLRLLVKPGMTGLWQVSGRSDLSWEDTVRLDVYYVENWSIASDLMILWKTAKAVVSASGAY